MDSKQATRKVSGQASWLVRVICNRKKIVRKNKDFFQFFFQKIVTNIVADPGSRIRCFFGIRDPGWVKNQVRIRNTVIFFKIFSNFLPQNCHYSVQVTGSRIRMGKKNQDPDQGFWIHNTAAIIFFLT